MRLLPILCLIAVVLTTSAARAAAPGIYFTGRLVDNCDAGIQSEGAFVALTLFDAAEGGNAVCGHLGSGPLVALDHGRFSVPLPENCTGAIRSHNPLWVEVTVTGTGLEVPPVTLSPRQAVGSVPRSAQDTVLEGIAAAGDGTIIAQPNRTYLLSATDAVARFILPTGVALGDKLRIVSTSSEGWRIEHGSEATIVGSGGLNTRDAVGGSGTGALRSLDPDASVELMAITPTAVSPTVWKIVSHAGKIDTDKQTLFAAVPDGSPNWFDARFDLPPDDTFHNGEPSVVSTGENPGHEYVMAFQGPTSPTGPGQTKWNIRLYQAKFAAPLPESGFEVVFSMSYESPPAGDSGSVYFAWGAATASGKTYSYGADDNSDGPAPWSERYSVPGVTGGQVGHEYSGPSLELQKFHWFRVQVVDDRVRYKTWEATKLEPVSWASAPHNPLDSGHTEWRIQVRDGGQAQVGALLVRKLTTFSDEPASAFYPPQSEVYAGQVP